MKRSFDTVFIVVSTTRTHNSFIEFYTNSLFTIFRLDWSLLCQKNSMPWIGAIVEEKHSWNISKSPINEVNRAGNQHKSLTYFGFHSKFIISFVLSYNRKWTGNQSWILNKNHSKDSSDKWSKMVTKDDIRLGRHFWVSSLGLFRKWRNR